VEELRLTDVSFCSDVFRKVIGEAGWNDSELRYQNCMRSLRDGIQKHGRIEWLRNNADGPIIALEPIMKMLKVSQLSELSLVARPNELVNLLSGCQCMEEGNIGDALEVTNEAFVVICNILSTLPRLERVIPCLDFT
jgi:hypothetical protein